MEVHLFSSPGNPPIRNIVRACRPILRGKPSAEVAYLPAAAAGDLFVRFTERSFNRLAKVTTLTPWQSPPGEALAALDRASVLYVPGGNTYLLAQRLHEAGLVDAVRERVLDGVPLVAFSAGAVLCGPTMLTTNDMNVTGSTHFGGLGLLPYNLNVHFPPEDGEQRSLRDERMWEYHVFNDNPVLALEDSAHVRVSDDGVEVLAGICWLYEKGKERVQVGVGKIQPR